MKNMSSPLPPTLGSPPAQLISRLKLLGVLAAFALPLLLASIWLQVVRSSGGDMANSARGELIRPALSLEAFSLSERSGATFDQQALRHIWTLWYAPQGECGKVCQTNLYHMRQIRLSLAQRMDRVQRVVLLTQPDQLPETLLAEHPGLRVLSGDHRALAEQFASAERGLPSRQDSIYLIDPLGNLMMRFPADLPPMSILKDIKHLLKVSRIG